LGSLRRRGAAARWAALLDAFCFPRSLRFALPSLALAAMEGLSGRE
jgi:hypothetical protein